jgi:hypothetical protein
VAGGEVAVDVDRRFQFFGIRIRLDLGGLTRGTRLDLGR